MASYKIDIAENKDQAAQLASQLICNHIRSTLTHKERCQIALSGGSTPAKAYTLLGREPIPWDRVDVFLGDERWVGSDDESSNALMIRRTLLASQPGCNASFYPVPTLEYQTPEESSLAFIKIIKTICQGNPPVFDLILLGLGEDGHTASLFPGSQALAEKKLFTAVSVGNARRRITLTAPVLCAANKVVFLVTGQSKQIALKRLVDPTELPSRTPAKLVQPNSEILVLADADAATQI
ncbi:6-phosphogluconolactonase [Prochlorococcus marinus]|uniref:6-phosphogluconolactonase n=1 Tax=Prochlorococcus marinus (strain MIT 9211) TaxID=93059 RepID=A9BAR0_PROM4|nr:6-phosphogluconolactonase [Prochlorococcus marinus]ABX08922.1 Putative 6-phosphogluconolactonase (DevB, Pgl) [Prochlorococcus marinus str. MIT 9211]